jgi:hypothetical protein
MKVTLATLGQATEQQVFDQVAVHMLTQKQRSSIDGVCAYRSLDGMCCAAGCLMDDDEYFPRFEGCTWDVLIQEHGVTTDHQLLIKALQNIHDRTKPERWVFGLYSLARQFELNVVALDAVCPPPPAVIRVRRHTKGVFDEQDSSDN